MYWDGDGRYLERGEGGRVIGSRRDEGVKFTSWYE
jgi:hypothetical protein